MAWAERARKAGYPERFAQEALGHNSKAVHRAYAKRAQVTLPSLEQYERNSAAENIIPLAQQTGSAIPEPGQPSRAISTKVAGLIQNMIVKNSSFRRKYLGAIFRKERDDFRLQFLLSGFVGLGRWRCPTRNRNTKRQEKLVLACRCANT